MRKDPDTRLISGSEVKAFQECQMQWWFKFRLGVAPKVLSDALFVGTVGHIALSDFYTALKNGESVEEGTQKMRALLGREMEKNTQHMLSGFVSATVSSLRMSLITEVMELLDEYVEYYGKSDAEKYEIVEVEHMHISGKFFAMRLDMLMRDRSNGKLELWDHKFVGSFYSEKQLRVNSQLPLYMKVVIGEREEQVAHGVLNQLKKKPTKEEKAKGLPRFTRPHIPYNEHAVKIRERDQHDISEDIRDFYRMPLMEAHRKVRRTLLDNTCKFCKFEAPCTASLNGDEGGMQALIHADYERSTYGYN